MRKNTSLIIAIIILTISIVVGAFYAYISNEQRKIDQRRIENEYYIQNGVFFMRGSDHYHWSYLPYDNVNEAKLYIALFCYEEYSDISINLDEIRDYLSSEYDESGDLRINHVPDRLNDYISWYLSWHDYKYGGEIIGDYISELQRIYISEIRNSNQDLPYSVEDLSLEQIQELINLEDNLDYEINTDLFRCN